MFTNFKLILATIVVLSLMAVIQCGKSIVSPKTINEQLLGQWQWVSSSVGGVAGGIRTPETEGYDIILTYDTDSTFNTQEIDSTGIVNAIGNYYTTYEPVRDENDSGDVIYMDNYLRSEFQINSDTLFISKISIFYFVRMYVRVTE